MITITLLTFIFTLLTGGHKSPFITPKLSKRVKKNVKDATKKKKVLAVIKDTNASQSRFDNRLKSYKKMLASLVGDKGMTKKEFADIFEGLLSDHKQLQKRIIDARLTMLNDLTPEEFETCIDKDYQPSKKAFAKTTKKLSEHFDHLVTAARKAIDESSAQKEVIAAINVFKKSSVSLIEAMSKMDVRDYEAIGRYDATRKDLLEITEANNDLRINLYEAFIDLHQNLAKATTDKQWKAAAKVLKTLLK